MDILNAAVTNLIHSILAGDEDKIELATNLVSQFNGGDVLAQLSIFAVDIIDGRNVPYIVNKLGFDVPPETTQIITALIENDVSFFEKYDSDEKLLRLTSDMVRIDVALRDAQVRELI